MVSKTRERFIEVARQLFASNGVENTTMNDIASASEKGRRTIYTYFKSKREIFNAVILSETKLLLERIGKIAALDMPADEKLMAFINIRFDTMSEIVARNGSLRARFFRDVRKVDRARKIITGKETFVLKKILKEGVDQGIFKISDLDETALIITFTLQGLDVPYVRDNISQETMNQEKIKRYITHLLFYGIKNRSTDIKGKQNTE